MRYFVSFHAFFFVFFVTSPLCLHIIVLLLWMSYPMWLLLRVFGRQAALEWPLATYISGDIDAPSIEQARIHKSVCKARVDYHVWDSTKLPVATSSIDVIFTDMPFGHVRMRACVVLIYMCEFSQCVCIHKAVFFSSLRFICLNSLSIPFFMCAFQRHGSVKLNQSLYPKLMHEWHRVLRVGGRVRVLPSLL